MRAIVFGEDIFPDLYPSIRGAGSATGRRERPGRPGIASLTLAATPRRLEATEPAASFLVAAMFHFAGVRRMKLIVNGVAHDVDAPADMPLLWAIRDLLGMTGTKYGCGMALCGACTVLIDGEPKRSCMTTAAAAADKRITTIEGLSEDGSHPVQVAWAELDVVQCGYCQSGQIMAAAALLANNPAPDDAAIDAAMNGLICRCGTYDAIRAGVKRAAELSTGGDR